MLICWAKKCGLSIQATLLFALLAFAVFPGIANAHGTADPIAIPSENAAYVDVNRGQVKDPFYSSSHCHSSFGQDCSTPIGFLITLDILTKTAECDVAAPVYPTLRTDWFLSFDPPPPRVLS